MEKELTCLRSIIADCDERITAALKTRMECIEASLHTKEKTVCPFCSQGAGEKAAGTGCR